MKFASVPPVVVGGSILVDESTVDTSGARVCC